MKGTIGRYKASKEYKRFEKWLIARGCEILPPTNEHELLRFRGRKTGVLYSSGAFSNDFAFWAFDAFEQNVKWYGAPVNTGRHPNYRKEKIELLDRDGTKCFFCGEEMGDDITVDHLVQLNSGGKNTINNMVLCHEKCNKAVIGLSVADKVRIALTRKQ